MAGYSKASLVIEELPQNHGIHQMTVDWLPSWLVGGWKWDIDMFEITTRQIPSAKSEVPKVMVHQNHWFPSQVHRKIHWKPLF